MCGVYPRRYLWMRSNTMVSQVGVVYSETHIV
ncbi:hypothetical protein VPHK397_0155 [Vibrio phage K397]